MSCRFEDRYHLCPVGLRTTHVDCLCLISDREVKNEVSYYYATVTLLDDLCTMPNQDDPSRRHTLAALPRHPMRRRRQPQSSGGRRQNRFPPRLSGCRVPRAFGAPPRVPDEPCSSPESSLSEIAGFALFVSFFSSDELAELGLDRVAFVGGGEGEGEGTF